jgi:hypothetical protein
VIIRLSLWRQTHVTAPQLLVTPPPRGDRTKSYASHLPLLLCDGENQMRSRRQGDSERGTRNGNGGVQTRRAGH